MKYNRKRIFVDRKVQGALALRVFFHWLLFCGVLSVILPIWQLLTAGNPLAFSTQACIKMWVKNIPLFVVLAMIFPAFAGDTIRLSNRFAGPISRLRQTMRRITKGEEVGDLKFRDGDFWSELATDFNAMRHKLESQQQNESAEQEPEPALSGYGEQD